MRISDWSSAVCSSDIPVEGAKARIEAALHGVDAAVMRILNDHSAGDPRNIAENPAISLRLDGDQVARPHRIESRTAGLAIRHGCSAFGQCACRTVGKADGGAVSGFVHEHRDLDRKSTRLNSSH